MKSKAILLNTAAADLEPVCRKLLFVNYLPFSAISLVLIAATCPAKAHA
jgi:hypothetical protein